MAFKTSSAFGCGLILQPRLPRLFPQHSITRSPPTLATRCHLFAFIFAYNAFTPRERTAFQTSAQNILKSFHANSAYPTGPFLCPPTGTLHKCPVLQWQNKHLPLHRTVSSYVLVSHPTTLTRPSTDWGPWETSMNTKRSVAEQLPVSQKQDPKAGPKAEWRGDSKGKVDSSKAVIFEGETMTPFSEEKRKLGRRAPMDSASLSTDSRGDCSSTHLQSWATSQEERLQTDPNPLNSQVRKREILSDIQLLVASGPATSNPIFIPCFLCH